MKRKQKRFLCGMTAAALLFLLAGCGETPDSPEASGTGDFSGQTLTVANWQSYGTDADYGAAQFEAMYGCTVEQWERGRGGKRDRHCPVLQREPKNGACRWRMPA